MNSPYWCSGCNSQGACELRARPGCHLTTLFRTDDVPSVTAIDAPAASKKNAWLPLLTVLFLISYSLMTMLIVEQGQTIQSQRALIRELFRDSTELSAVKMKPVQDSTQNPSSQIPSTQIPSTQAPTTTQAPSSQAGPQQQRAQGKSTKQKPDFKMPSKPAADLVDDVRTLITI
jgi:hypothetical protein